MTPIHARTASLAVLVFAAVGCADKPAAGHLPPTTSPATGAADGAAPSTTMAPAVAAPSTPMTLDEAAAFVQATAARAVAARPELRDDDEPIEGDGDLLAGPGCQRPDDDRRATLRRQLEEWVERTTRAAGEGAPHDPALVPVTIRLGCVEASGVLAEVHAWRSSRARGAGAATIERGWIVRVDADVHAVADSRGTFTDAGSSGEWLRVLAIEELDGHGDRDVLYARLSHDDGEWTGTRTWLAPSSGPATELVTQANQIRRLDRLDRDGDTVTLALSRETPHCEVDCVEWTAYRCLVPPGRLATCPTADTAKRLATVAGAVRVLEGATPDRLERLTRAPVGDALTTLEVPADRVAAVLAPIPHAVEHYQTFEVLEPLTRSPDPLADPSPLPPCQPPAPVDVAAITERLERWIVTQDRAALARAGACTGRCKLGRDRGVDSIEVCASPTGAYVSATWERAVSGVEVDGIEASTMLREAVFWVTPARVEVVAQAAALEDPTETDDSVSAPIEGSSLPRWLAVSLVGDGEHTSALVFDVVGEQVQAHRDGARPLVAELPVGRTSTFTLAGATVIAVDPWDAPPDQRATYLRVDDDGIHRIEVPPFELGQPARPASPLQAAVIEREQRRIAREVVLSFRRARLVESGYRESLRTALGVLGASAITIDEITGER